MLKKHNSIYILLLNIGEKHLNCLIIMGGEGAVS